MAFFSPPTHGVRCPRCDADVLPSSVCGCERFSDDDLASLRAEFAPTFAQCPASHLFEIGLVLSWCLIAVLLWRFGNVAVGIACVCANIVILQLRHGRRFRLASKLHVLDERRAPQLAAASRAAPVAASSVALGRR